MIARLLPGTVPGTITYLITGKGTTEFFRPLPKQPLTTGEIPGPHTTRQVLSALLENPTSSGL